MEKFKELLERTQIIEEGIGNFKLIPTPDDVVSGVSRGLKKLLGSTPKSTTKASNQIQTDNQTQFPDQIQTDNQTQFPALNSPLLKKKRENILYFKLQDKSLPNPLYIKYDIKTKNVEFIDEVNFKRMS